MEKYTYTHTFFQADGMIVVISKEWQNQDTSHLLRRGKEIVQGKVHSQKQVIGNVLSLVVWWIYGSSVFCVISNIIFCMYQRIWFFKLFLILKYCSSHLMGYTWCFLTVFGTGWLGYHRNKQINSRSYSDTPETCPCWNERAKAQCSWLVARGGLLGGVSSL